MQGLSGIAGRRRRSALLVSLTAAALTSCAYGYTEADGTRRIIGLVDLEIRPSADERTIAGEVVDVRTVGLSLLETGDETSVALGYQRHIAAALRDNALVLGNPLTASREQKAQGPKQGGSNGN